MPVIDRVEVDDDLLRELEQAAAARGVTVAEEAGARIEASVRRAIEREKLITTTTTFGDALQRQETEAPALLPQDCDR